MHSDTDLVVTIVPKRYQSIEHNRAEYLVYGRSLLKGYGRRRLDRDQVTGRDANRLSADQDRALRELVPHFHVDAHWRTRWAQQPNRRNETQPARIQPRSGSIRVCTAARVIPAAGTVLRFLHASSVGHASKPNLRLCCSPVIWTLKQHRPSAVRTLRHRNAHGRTSSGTRSDVILDQYDDLAPAPLGMLAGRRRGPITPPVAPSGGIFLSPGPPPPC